MANKNIKLMMCRTVTLITEFKLLNRMEKIYRSIPELSKKSYSDRLKTLKLPTLTYRRYRGDMIELFKIIKGIIYDPMCVPHFELTETSEDYIKTRGNKYKLTQQLH